jgi:hypothetical protein
MLADGVTMALYWKADVSAVASSWWVVTSTDGWVTRTAKVKVLEDLTSDQRLLSSALVLEPAGGYSMWSVDYLAGAVVRRQSATHNGTFATPTTCTVPAWLVARLWHIDVIVVSGVYYMLVSSAERTTGDQLYLLSSTDGLTWTKTDTVADIPTSDGRGWYRSSLVSVAPSAWNVYAARRDISGTVGTWRLMLFEGTTLPTPAAVANTKNIREAQLAIGAFDAGWVVADNFNRADSVSSLGSALTGQAWVQNSGVSGINGQAAYTTTNTARVTIDALISDVEIRADLAGAVNEWWVYLRYVDASNWWRIGIDGATSRMTVQRFLTGVLTTPAQLPLVNLRVADQLKVIAVGPSIKVYRNNLLVFSLSDASMQTGTKHGFGMLTGGGSKLDLFGVRAAT